MRTQSKKPEKKSEEIDGLIGENVKSIRKIKQLSQQELATRLGISFQQIQKYEAGQNRINASMLYRLSLCLEVSVSEFYVGLDKKGKVDDVLSACIAQLDHEALELLQSYRSIPSRSTRTVVRELIQSLAG